MISLKNFVRKVYSDWFCNNIYFNMDIIYTIFGKICTHLKIIHTKINSNCYEN